ncbi:MAG: SRPBCC domain-containing protein [Thaumarchaeota archaeon]|nr:SRPBCC domain-containing protein [Nitrososphaerota archaeon]
MKFETIRQKVLIDATPEEVYEAYVDPKKHTAFTGSAATGSPKVGGKFTAWGGYIEGRFVELKEGRKIVHEWKTTEWPAGYPQSLVTLTLKLKGRRTELTMVHSKAPSEQAESYADGWVEFYWEPMKKYFGKRS